MYGFNEEKDLWKAKRRQKLENRAATRCQMDMEICRLLFLMMTINFCAAFYTLEAIPYGFQVTCGMAFLILMWKLLSVGMYGLARWDGDLCLVFVLHLTMSVALTISLKEHPELLIFCMCPASLVSFTTCALICSRYVNHKGDMLPNVRTFSEIGSQSVYTYFPGVVNRVQTAVKTIKGGAIIDGEYTQLMNQEYRRD